MGRMNDYYIPPTIKELIRALQRQINDPNSEIDGDEHIIDAFLITESDQELPPCTLGLSLRKNGINEEDAEFGTLYIPPCYPKRFM